jgi:expansin (peptidoglycan-binding protein)
MGAPERLARCADAPNRLHRSYQEQRTWRARRQWRPHALARVLKVRKCHDGAWNTLAKREWTDLVYAVRTRLYALHVQCPHTSTLSNSILSGSRTVSAI